MNLLLRVMQLKMSQTVSQCCQLGSFRMREILIFQHLYRVKLGFLRERTRMRKINIFFFRKRTDTVKVRKINN